ncbi:1,4-alpha-glucan branching protein GlgB [Arsenicicoccus dermatophilus]|uniref:1,4-alpha-glucan branching protein GlgB n=1 Tax=Arsenicicoccus dermatophilus TaxID=1076331 RepID=UPI0039171884
MAGISRIEKGATITPDKRETVQAWIGRQRWYVGKGSGTTPQLEHVGSYRFEDPAHEVGVETLLLRDVSVQPPVTYQVPLTYRGAPLEGAEDALVGVIEHSVLGTRHVYDAPHDPVYVAELVRTVVEADTGSTPDHGTPDVHVVGEPTTARPPVSVRSARVLSGEQSNTSIIVETDAEPLIVKVFRVLSPGDNPDVTVQTALAGAGSTLVPSPAGALRGRWTRDGRQVTGHLAFAQEFLPDVRDAWRVALESAAAGGDFTGRARALGVATGQVHRTLADTMETAAATVEDRRTLALSMRNRFVLAAEAHPPLRTQEAEIERVLGAARDAEWPRLQRIHGDYHLGQVLDVPGRGWVLLDFEGEPLRPLRQRTRPDLVLRDVAGMLRSFDYAAGSVAQEDPARAESARAWADAARAAFLEGYAEASGLDPRREPEVLRALELDKALYEIDYEARNRPSWLPIPTTAVARLVTAAADAVPQECHAPDALEDETPTAPAEVAASSPTPPVELAASTPTAPVEEESAEAPTAGASRQARNAPVSAAVSGLAAQLGSTARLVARSARSAVRTATTATTTAVQHAAADARATEPVDQTQPSAPDAPEQVDVQDPGDAAGREPSTVEALEPVTSLEAPEPVAPDPDETTTAEPTPGLIEQTPRVDEAPAPGAPTPATTGADDEPVPPAYGQEQDPVTDARPPRAVSRHLPMPTDQIDRLVHGHHHDPHAVLGGHVGEGVVTIRTLKPRAATVDLLLPGGHRLPFEHEHEGVWVATIEGTEVPDYRVAVDYGDGFEHTVDDPYRFLPTLGEMDIHLIGEGRHERLWEVLGAHVREYDGPMGVTRGTAFAVWAPNARAVRLAGDVNTWDSGAHPMRSLGSSGLWELFVPGVEEGTRYKYDILGKDGRWRGKADPLARATEIPPATASVVERSSYTWHDQEWLARRDATSRHEAPMSVYEVHLGSWRQGLSYTELATQLVDYVKDLGFTHVELLPVAEHPYGPSWGYQVTGYYAPTSRFGSPDEFRHLVDALHQAGIGVILDWVPAHFPKDAFALARFDGEAVYEHPDPRRGDQPDWGTHVFDFGRPQVRNFLVANALFWLDEFHVDGLRVDAVASMLYLDYSRNDGEWLPNVYGGREHLEAVQMLQETNATVYRHHPGAVMIAEESTSWPGVTRPTETGGLGFGFKWNMGWMHDTLDYVEHDPVHRQYHHGEMTFGLVYAFSENFVLPISHDEVVYGKGSLLRKMPGDRWQQLANLRAYLAFMWAHPGKKLLFMGQEFAQEAEWADGSSLDWWLLDQPCHLAAHQMVRSMNATYQASPALWQLDTSGEGFQWIDANDAMGNVFSFVRYGKDDGSGRVPAVACVANFAGAPHEGYRIGLPGPGVWREVLNTDATEWHGSGVGNLGQVVAEPVPWHGFAWSAVITCPPLATVWLAAEQDVERHREVSRAQERPELVAAAEARREAEAREAGDAAERPELSETSAEG